MIDKSVFLRYQALGFNLIPLGNDKRPVETHTLPDGRPMRFSWRKDATDKQPIDYWYSLSNNDWWQNVEGIAAICGEVSGGLFCIDFDGLDNEAHLDSALQDLGIGKDWLVDTPGGGKHVWLFSDLQMEKNILDNPGVEGGAAHVELRGAEHMTTLPPSIHPNGGQYAFRNGEPTGPPPFVDGDKLLEVYLSLVVEPEVRTREYVGGPVTVSKGSYGGGQEVTQRYVDVAVDNILAELRGATNGIRNRELNKATFAMGQLIGDGLIDEGTAVAQLEDAAIGLGLDQHEIRATIRSALRSGSSESRGLVLKPFVPTYKPRQDVDLQDGEAIYVEWGPQSQGDLYDVMPDDGGIMDAWLNQYGYQWMFLVGHDHWLSWAESHWRQDEGLTIQKEVQTHVKTLNEKAAEKLTEAEMDSDKPAIRKAREYLSATRRTSSRINSVMAMARAEKAVQSDQLDGDGSLLNFLNCTLDLDTYEPRDHSPRDFITHCLPYNYDATATCPRWEQFLSEVLVKEGTLEPDEELIQLLRELMGYGLTSDTSHEVMVWFQGEGSNGKTVAVTVISQLLGSLAMSVNFHRIGTPGNYELAHIAGKRILFSTESERGQSIQEGVIKNIVSGERINTRPIYGSPFEFKPVGKIFWASNNLPVIRDTSDSIWRRLKLIAMHRQFSEAEKDTKLTQKLLSELPGILNWALGGLYNLRQRGRFTTPKSSAAAIDALKLDTNPIARWMDESTMTTIDGWTSAKELYANYADWVVTNGNMKASSNTFGQELKRLGVDHKKSNGIKYAIVLVSMAGI